MVAQGKASAYDAHAEAYQAYVKGYEALGPAGDPTGVLPEILSLLGDVAGEAVLDAGCGEGYLSRVLAARGACVTGIDLSPRLIDMARAQSPAALIDYRVADLSRPLPELAGRFDATGSFLVLNDVEDHRGFAATLAQLLRPGGRAVLGLNNPYSAAVRKRLPDYLASGTVHPSGLAGFGVPVPFYHRTVADYLDAFLDAGLQLTKLIDVDHPGVAAARAAGRALADGERLPRYTVLAFRTPLTP